MVINRDTHVVEKHVMRRSVDDITSRPPVPQRSGPLHSGLRAPARPQSCRTSRRWRTRGSAAPHTAAAWQRRFTAATTASSPRHSTGRNRQSPPVPRRGTDQKIRPGVSIFRNQLMGLPADAKLVKKNADRQNAEFDETLVSLGCQARPTQRQETRSANGCGSNGSAHGCARATVAEGKCEMSRTPEGGGSLRILDARPTRVEWERLMDSPAPRAPPRGPPTARPPYRSRRSCMPSPAGR